MPLLAKDAAPVQDAAIDTALLPLVKHTVPVAGIDGITAGDGGGIAAIGNDVIICDWHGGFALWQDKSNVLKPLAFPRLPNHIAEYAAHLEAGRKKVPGAFRVHAIAARATPQGLALYVAHEAFLPVEKTTALTVSQITLDTATYSPVTPWSNVYTGTPLKAEKYAGIGAGGRMVLEGSTLYLAAGDYNQDTVFMGSAPEAQNPDTDFGKIMAIDLVTLSKNRLTLGHRNPQGLMMSGGRTLYSTEHGPKGGDELNIIEPGQNYGWPYETYGTHYSTYDWPVKAPSAHEPFRGPVFAWVPSIAVSNLIEARSFNPAWRGDLIVGSLKARSLFRLRLDSSRHVVYSEPIFIGERLRDLAERADGRLVLWTDDAHLIVLSVDTTKLASNQRVEAAIDSKELEPCWTCHHTGPTSPQDLAPSLSKVFGRKIASDAFDHYSPALKERGGFWSEENLIDYLVDPPAFAKGTAMPYRAGSAVEVAKIVKGLRDLD